MARVKKQPVSRRTASRSRRRAGRYVDLVGIRGFMRVQLTDARNGEILGDSGYRKNQVTNHGKDVYIVRSIGGIAANKTVSHLAIATQTTAPAAADTSVQGEFGGRKLLNDTTDTGSNRKLLASVGTLQMIASWAGADLGTDSPKTIGAIAAFNTSSGGSMLCAATYPTSQWTSDQNVNATYELRVS